MITVNDTQARSGVYKNVKVDYILAVSWQCGVILHWFK